MAFIYSLSFPNGKKYVGMTIQSLPKRLTCHRRYANKGSKRLLYNAWRKHGEPTAQILAIVEDKMLKETERKAIAVFGTLTPAGYNMTEGAEGVVCAEVRSALSAIHKGRPKSDEHRRKISLGQMGRPGTWTGKKQSPEHIAKRIRPAGWHHSQETKDAISRLKMSQHSLKKLEKT